MEKWDIDDYLEEIKFQMTEYEDLTEEVILEWESKARTWILKHVDNKKIIKKSKEDILIEVKEENIMYEIALKYNNYRRKGLEEKYWKEFKM